MILCYTDCRYDVLICIAETQTAEKKDALRQAGATLVEVPAVPFSNQNHFVHVASRLADAVRAGGDYEHVLYANQWDNPGAYYMHVLYLLILLFKFKHYPSEQAVSCRGDRT